MDRSVHRSIWEERAGERESTYLETSPPSLFWMSLVDIADSSGYCADYWRVVGGNRGESGRGGENVWGGGRG